jgi:DNA-directed RNA polymerase specialized sigma24 family protein
MLEQWARWQHGILGVGLGYQGLSGSRYTRPDELNSAPIQHGDPRFDRLMLDVERALASLPGSLQDIVRAQYLLDDGWTMLARAKRCHVSMDTYYRRLKIAHAHIAEQLRGG